MKDIRLSLLAMALIFVECSSDEENQITLSAVVGLVIDDVTNKGHAADVQVAFTSSDDEEELVNYRFFMVKSGKASAFNRSQAETAMADFVEFVKRSAKTEFTLASDFTDTDGEAIIEGVSYTGFILSMGVEGVSNVLSSPSNAITLKQASIKITYIGNDGVHISDGTQAVIIDALPGDLSGWSPIASGVQSAIEQGSGEFGHIKVAMVTHAHGDHVSSASINRFLNANAGAQVILPAGLHGSISHAAQISDLAPARGTSAEETFNGIKISVLHMRHFDLFGNDFSSVDNYGYLVEIGGKKVLHLGDVYYSEANFSPFDLSSKAIDVALIPTFNTLVSSANKALIEEQIAPAHLIGLHLQSSTALSTVYSVYPDAVVFKTSMAFERY